MQRVLEIMKGRGSPPGYLAANTGAVTTVK
jgi:hypothetical protein